MHYTGGCSAQTKAAHAEPRRPGLSQLEPRETPAHPPIAPPPVIAADPSDAPSNWPKVLGIIAIIIGSFGVMQGSSGLMFPVILDSIEIVMSRSGGPDIVASLREWQDWILTGSMLGAGIAALLLAVGIGLLMRRPWSIRFGYVWATVKIIFVLANSIVSYFIQLEVFNVMANLGTALPPGFIGLFEIMAVLGTAIAIVWGWALPVIMIVWFLRPRIRAEVSAWCGDVTNADDAEGV